MKVSIYLKPVDADGFGGNLLLDLGGRRSLKDPTRFIFTNSFDPAIVAPPDFDTSQWAVKYTDILRDHGVRPMRVQLHNDATFGLTPMYASTTGPKTPEAKKVIKKALALVSAVRLSANDKVERDAAVEEADDLNEKLDAEKETANNEDDLVSFVASADTKPDPFATRLSASRRKHFIEVIEQPRLCEDGVIRGKAAFHYVGGSEKDKRYAMTVRLDREGKLRVKDGQLRISPQR